MTYTGIELKSATHNYSSLTPEVHHDGTTLGAPAVVLYFILVIELRIVTICLPKCPYHVHVSGDDGMILLLGRCRINVINMYES